MSKIYKAAWVVSILFLIVGLLLMGKETATYPTNEYWVAKNYRHVYEQYSGEIVDYIEEDETCKIKNGNIIVTRKKAGAVGYAFGSIITFTSACIIVGLIIMVAPNKSDKEK